MQAEPSQEPTDVNAILQARAEAAANRVVEEEGALIAGALESGNITEIESTFYQVCRRIYLQGYVDGRS